MGSSYIDRDEILKRITLVKNTVNSKDLPNIYVLHGEFTDAEMNELYNHSKVKAMVSLTKGEGYGRPLLEFSLTKKPTTVPSGYQQQMLIELYTPKARVSENSELFYEWGQKYDIYTSGGVRYHRGQTGNQTATQPATFQWFDKFYK